MHTCALALDLKPALEAGCLLQIAMREIGHGALRALRFLLTSARGSRIRHIQLARPYLNPETHGHGLQLVKSLTFAPLRTFLATLALSIDQG